MDTRPCVRGFLLGQVQNQAESIARNLCRGFHCSAQRSRVKQKVWSKRECDFQMNSFPSSLYTYILHPVCCSVTLFTYL